MAKKVIRVTKETKDFVCDKCKQLVDVSLAESWIIETDEVIIKTWDYGHGHKKLLFPSDTGFRSMEGKI